MTVVIFAVTMISEQPPRRTNNRNGLGAALTTRGVVHEAHLEQAGYIAGGPSILCMFRHISRREPLAENFELRSIFVGQLEGV
jgi:hypothetical protein